MHTKLLDCVSPRNTQLGAGEANTWVAFRSEFCRISWMEDKVGKRVEDTRRRIIGKMDCEILRGREENKAKKDL